jgi:hypothetical protein
MRSTVAPSAKRISSENLAHSARISASTCCSSLMTD